MLKQYRAFPCGGDGTSGVTRWHGLFTGWLFHNLGTIQMNFQTVKPLKDIWTDIMVTSMIFLGLLLECTLDWLCSSRSSLHTAFGPSISRRDSFVFPVFIDVKYINLCNYFYY